MDDRIRRFVDQHVRARECSVCGGTEWFLVNEGKRMSFLSFAATHDPRIDVIGVCCGTCGYMRFHSAEIVGDAD